MTELNLLALGLFLVVSLGFTYGLVTGAFAIERGLKALAEKVEKAMTVTVTQPPITVNTPPMTVTSPPAILPPELLETLRQVQEKLQPPPQPLLDDSALAKLVGEGVALADGMKGVKGPDKFRAARSYVTQQAQARGLAVDDRALALSIEATVLAMRTAKKAAP